MVTPIRISSPRSIRKTIFSRYPIPKRFESKYLDCILKVLLTLAVCGMWLMNYSFFPKHTNVGNGVLRLSSAQRNMEQKHGFQKEPQFHIVFSTGCNALQTWESYLFFYHVWRSGQKGNVTRVASGCTKEEAIIVREAFEKNIVQGIPTGNRFHLHLTPDFSRVHQGIITNKEQKDPYKFFNKPFGLKHWFDNGLQFGNNLHNGGVPQYSLPPHLKDTIIIVLDPDQIILKPFKFDYTNDPFVRKYPNDTPLVKGEVQRIQKGKPYSQVYLYGGDYIKRMTGPKLQEVIQAAANVSNQRLATKHITPTNNGLLDWTVDIADKKYAAGPPYIAMAEDMYNIVTTWSAIAVPVYKHTNDFLSEMMAYSTAAAYLKLEHQLLTSFMISVPGLQKNEGWHALTDVPHARFVLLSEPDYKPRTDLPEILHFCQRYYIGPYFFSKYKVPKDIMNCNSSLLLEPPYTVTIDPKTKKRKVVLTEANKNKKCADVVKDYTWSKTPDGVNNTYNLFEARHHTFALCHLLHKFNDAILYWKEKHCPAGYNTEKSFIFADYYNDELMKHNKLP